VKPDVKPHDHPLLSYSDESIAMPSHIEAAFHEAAHAVVAHTSAYFTLAGTVSIQNAGTGFADIGPSRRKLTAAAKPIDASIDADPQIASELAIILLAGIEGEIIAEEQNTTLRADVDRSEPDICFAVEKLEAAKVATDLDVLRGEARERLEANWSKVERLAQQLIAQGALPAVDVVDLLNEA
jgi:hypothetical protein